MSWAWAINAVHTRAPTTIEPGGTYAHSPSAVSPYLGYWLPLAITKNTPFPYFLGKSSRDYGQNTPFPEKMGTPMHAAPLCIRLGGPGVHKKPDIKAKLWIVLVHGENKNKYLVFC